MQLKRYEIVGSIPVSKNLAKNEIILRDEYISSFLKQSINSEPMPAVTEMNFVWEPASKALVSVWNLNVDEKEALDKAVEVIKAQIKTQAK